VTEIEWIQEAKTYVDRLMYDPKLFDWHSLYLESIEGGYTPEESIDCDIDYWIDDSR